MERRDIELDLINSVIEQIIGDIHSGSYEALEEMLGLIVNSSNVKYLIGYLGNEELINKYNELLK